MNRVDASKLVLIFFSWIFLPNHVLADKATEIAQMAYERDDGKDSSAEVEMTLTDDSGNTKVRTLTIMTKDFGSLTKRYIRFNEPAAIKNTTFLSVEKPSGDDDQFLYLPSLGRSRRIASDQKERSFVNTTFSYEDLERRSVDRDIYTLLGTKKYLDRSCWELTKKARSAEDSHYHHVSLLIDQEIHLVLYSSYFDDDSAAAVKVFEVSKFEPRQGIWTVMESKMTDVVNKESTLLRVKDIVYNAGLTDDIFTQQYIEHPN